MATKKLIKGRYEPTGKTLEGGQGVILVCKDRFLERKVAIKFLKNVADRQTLLKEVSAIREIKSKHVIEIYDLILDESEDVVGIVEEYLPGQEVKPWEPGTKDETKSAFLKVLYQIASGLSDIHAHGRVHRDVKPINMKFDGEGLLKIFDFGISGLSTKGDETHAGHGTPWFRGPEYYTGKPTKIQPSMDVYAFGVTVWYLTEGDVPPALKEIPPQSVSKPPSFESLKVGFSPSLVKLLNRAIEPNPSARPTMHEISQDIKKQLLYGKHRARFESYELNKPQDGYKLGNAFGEAIVRYDGYDFVLEKLSGDVYVNNVRAAAGDRLPGPCVITFGSSEKQNARRFVQFDISNPELVL